MLTLDTGFPSLAVARRNQQFLDALEFVDEVIEKHSHFQVNVFRSKIQRGAYTLGSGLVKKSYRFHPGTADQRGLHRWRPIQISRAASGGDPGVDACAYNPYKVGYGFETINYTGFQTERSTDPICIRDLRFTWQFQQQLGLVLGFLADVTNSVWENLAREHYIKFTVDGGKGYVLSEGAPNTHTFTYDPFAVDADGDNTIQIAQAIPISTLNWNYLRWLSRWLQMQAPMAAIGNLDGRPSYGLVFDLEDWDKMIETDSDLRQDFRYARPTLLVENYGKVDDYKGFALMHDIGAPRFAVKSADGTFITLKRVDPLVEDEAVTIGNKVTVNPDYLNAEFSLAIIFLERVYMLEIPPAGPAAPGGGTSFGATPSLNGEFAWLNIQNAEDNLLRENGFYFSRFESFAKPGMHNYDAISFIYRRCPHVAPTDCNIGGTDTAAAAAEVGLASDAVAADVDATNFTLTLTLASILSEEAPEAVTIKDNDAATQVGVIADSSQAPTYVFAVPDFDTISSDEAKYTAAGAASVTGV